MEVSGGNKGKSEGKDSKPAKMLNVQPPPAATAAVNGPGPVPVHVPVQGNPTLQQHSLQSSVSQGHPEKNIASTPQKDRPSTSFGSPQQGYYPMQYSACAAPPSTGKSPATGTGTPGPSTPGGIPPIPPLQQHHAHYYPYGAPPPYHHHPPLPLPPPHYIHGHAAPLSNIQHQPPPSNASNASTPIKAKSSPSMTSPSGSSVSGIAPSPVRSAGQSTVHNSGSSSAYGWNAGAPYHHPQHAMAPHAAAYRHGYGSPDSHWTKGAAPQQQQQQQQAQPHPLQPPPQSYGWPPPQHPHAVAAAQQHHPSYPYHPQYAGGRYVPPPPPPPTGRYPWPQQTTSSSLLQHRKPPPLVPRSGTKPPVLVTRSLGSATKLKVSTSKSKLDEAREGATSPTEIETHHRDEVQHMGCTCKKTRCLKLYCQCFGVKLYCGNNCRCLLCYNSRKHEKQRKEAMRSILSRNPSAFDTKFKTDPNSSAAVPPSVAPVIEPVAIAAAVPSAEATTTTDANRVLAHRLGCKCRKSACMKKYCECYAGNVKCTPSCRCMGCKNMGGSADFRDHPNSGEAMGIMVSAAAHAMHYRHMPQHPSTYMSMPHHLQQQQQQQQHPVMRASNDPWIAAQSLTFLKRSSPASDRRDVRLFSMGVSPIAKSTAVAENASMPSLASSSEGTSPGEGAHHHYPRIASTPESSIDKAGGDSALLMAAVAMTEFGQSPPPTSSMLSPKTIRTYSGTDDNNDNESIGENEAFSNASKRSINFDESAGDLKGKRAKTGWMD